MIARITANYSNIQIILQNGLQTDNPDLKASIYCACSFSSFSRMIGRGKLPLMDQIDNILLQPRDHQLDTCVITELIHLWMYQPVSNPDALITRAFENVEHFDNTDVKGVFCQHWFFSARY